MGASSGTFMYIGTVVAEVNGQPIYANKILSKVDAELSAKAPLLEPGEFRAAATNAILKQIKYDIALEQEYAAPRTAAFVREALEAYEQRGLLAADERSAAQI